MLAIFAASSNSGKIGELQLGVRLWNELTGALSSIQFAPLPDFDRLPACVEDADTFAGNAQKKALHYSRFTEGLVLADDSGLEVDWLNGAPGVYSRRFAGPSATDVENNGKLLQLLRGVPPESRAARFVCELALAREGKSVARFRGVAEGVILESPRGAHGFGYDPLFLDPETRKTFAELTPEEKLRRSHRGKALWAMLQALEKSGGEKIAAEG